MLADSRRHGETQVGIDVDLADCASGRLPEHIFRNTLGAGHAAAILIDHFHKLRNDRAGAVQHDGETGQKPETSSRISKRSLLRPLNL